MTSWTAKSRIVATWALAIWVPALAATAAIAGGTLGVDVPMLNELLPALTPEEIEVALASETTVTVLLEDLKVLGFDPAAGEGSSGHILTSLRVKIPDFGIAVPLEPRISLGVVEQAGTSLLELRFEQAEISLPLMGSVNIGTLIPPIRFPAESIFMLQGANGEVPMRSRLTGVKMGQKLLRFEFELKRE